jgi:hypothetical protein
MHSIQSKGLLLLGALALTACGGSAQYSSVNATASGLRPGATVIMQDGNGKAIALYDNRAFTFLAAVEVGTRFNISIKEQPVGEACVVSNGSGVVEPTPANVDVRCKPIASVIGLVVGPVGNRGLTLALNGIPTPIADAGFFAFPGLLPAGTAYTVTNTASPGLVCSIFNTSGTIAADAFTYVTVSCHDPNGPDHGTA